MNNEQVMRGEPAFGVPQDDVIGVDKPEDLGLDTGFFEDFASGRFRRRLARLDVAAGQAPHVLAWTFPAPSDQHFIATEYRGACGGPRPWQCGYWRSPGHLVHACPASRLECSPAGAAEGGSRASARSPMPPRPTVRSA